MISHPLRGKNLPVLCAEMLISEMAYFARTIFTPLTGIEPLTSRFAFENHLGLTLLRTKLANVLKAESHIKRNRSFPGVRLTKRIEYIDVVFRFNQIDSFMYLVR